MKEETPCYFKALTDTPFVLGLNALYSMLFPLRGINNRLQGRVENIYKVHGKITAFSEEIYTEITKSDDSIFLCSSCCIFTK